MGNSFGNERCLIIIGTTRPDLKERELARRRIAVDSEDIPITF
jgi:hypothetical protein